MTKATLRRQDLAGIASLLKVWGEPGTPAAPPPPPTRDALFQRYRDQRDGVLASIARSVEAEDLANWSTIAAELHKIAGTAAHFGQAELGAISRRLEHLLVNATRDEERAAALCAVLPELRAAA